MEKITGLLRVCAHKSLKLGVQSDKSPYGKTEFT